MKDNKEIVSQVIKSTFLTLVLFMLFDIFVQGYSSYHNWLVLLSIGLFAVYHLRLSTEHY